MVVIHPMISSVPQRVSGLHEVTSEIPLIVQRTFRSFPDTASHMPAVNAFICLPTVRHKTLDAIVNALEGQLRR
jgi:hypothetical protein